MFNSTTLIGLMLLAIFSLVWFATRLAKTRSKNAHPYRQLAALFTPAERSFYGVLTQAVNGDALIFGKVRVADVLTPQKSSIKGVWQTAFNKISAKHFDFVLCKKDDLTFICAIELDDSSHNSAKSKARDAFLETACQSADFSLLRYRAKASYQVTEVRDVLAKVLAGAQKNNISPITPSAAPVLITPVLAGNDSEKVCPKCSSEMTVRVAKKGKTVGNEFWGCTAFPQCRHVEPFN